MKLFNSFKKTFKRISDNAIHVNLIILGVLTAVVVLLSVHFVQDSRAIFIEQIIYTSYGMLFDILIIGILITWLNDRRESRFRIQSYINEIDDFRNWVSEEAMFRTVGNIKRLNKNDITEMNLVDCTLQNINLNNCDLTGSNLNSADISHSELLSIKMNNCRLNQANFENSNMNHAQFINSYATGTNFRDTFLIKSNFEGAYLIKSDFENSFLIEANLKNAVVSDANFKNASLYKADFTGARGLTAQQLIGAKSLYLTKLDADVEKKLREIAPYLFNE